MDTANQKPKGVKKRMSEVEALAATLFVKIQPAYYRALGLPLVRWKWSQASRQNRASNIAAARYVLRNYKRKAVK